MFFVDADRKRVLLDSDGCLGLIRKAFLREGRVALWVMDLEMVGLSWELLLMRIAQTA